MSQFETTDNVSGHVELTEINKRNEAELNSLSNIKNIKRPTFEWNDKSWQAFKEVVATGVPMNGKESYYNGWGFARSVMSNKGTNFENPGFMEKCDLRQGQVKHIILNMIRLRAREYNEDGEPTGKTKEYLTYQMQHWGKDWLGRKIASPTIDEGVYEKWTTKTEIVNFDSNTGEPRIETRLGEAIYVYYIPFEGKKTIQQIFKTYPGSEDSIENTLFYCKYGGNGKAGTRERNNQYTYEQFANSDFEHLVWLNRRLGGASGSNQMNVSPERALYSACPCSNCKKQAKNTSVQ